MANIRSESFWIFFEFLFAEVSVIVAVEEFVVASSIFDGFEFGLIE